MHQRLDRGLPFEAYACRVVQRDERSAVGQRYRIIELALPTPVSIRRKASDRGTRKSNWAGLFCG